MDLSGSWDYIEETAKSRLAHNKTPHHTYTYGESIEVMGVAGEVAARRFLGLDETLHTYFDGGVDFRVAGKNVDIKATQLTSKLQYRYLQWPAWKDVKSDLIVMTAVDIPSRQAVVVGYATKEEIENAPVNMTRPTPCHEIPVSQLHPAWELVMQKLHNNTRQ